MPGTLHYANPAVVRTFDSFVRKPLSNFPLQRRVSVLCVHNQALEMHGKRLREALIWHYYEQARQQRRQR